ncbi:MAG: NAD(P)H-dependent oxidoreductase subunit E [Lentisphaerae bacterium]|nr:NAD(P)H-dependent oxidoreductase subunit E [Lentisphaerota bacterium]
MVDMEQIKACLAAIAPEPGNLIRGLQAIQTGEGYVSDEAIKAASDYFKVPVAEVEGVLSFYAQFKRVKPGRFTIAVCDGTACHIKGSPLIMEWLSDALKIRPGETDAQGNFSIEKVSCLGCCSLAPVMAVNGTVYGKLDRKKVVSILKEYQNK